MKDLIKALQIFIKYGNPVHPCHCEHDKLWVTIDNEIVSEEDKILLDALGFFEEDGGFASYKFGSC